MTHYYDIGIIDKSILMHRNYSMLKGTFGDKLTAGLLIKSCIQSIFKIAREQLEVGKYILVADSKPYHKSKILVSQVGQSEYKTNRPKEKDNFMEIYAKASYGLAEFGNRFGVNQYRVDGYEADDLAYLISQNLKTDHKNLIISFDSDWFYLVNDHTDYYNMRHRKIYNYDRCCKYVHKTEHFNLLDTMIIRTAFKGSHNNLKQTIKNEYLSKPSKWLMDNYLAGNDFIFTDKDLFEAQLKTWNMEQYPDYDKVINLANEVVKPTKLGSLDDFRSFRDKYEFNIPTFRYKEFISNIDPKYNISCT